MTVLSGESGGMRSKQSLGVPRSGESPGTRLCLKEKERTS